MLDAKFGAELVELMAPGRCPCPGRPRRLHLQIAQIADPMPAQTPVQPRTRDILVEELADHGEQVVERHQQILRKATATASCAGAKVVCNRCGLWLRSCTVSRCLHLSTVGPKRAARSHVGSSLA